MPFDQSTRNRLARFVGDARAKLTEEFTRQLQQEYGIDPARGEVTDLARLSHLDDSRRATAVLLRETLDYYLASQPKADARARRETLDRIVREQAFTILNRLCALRMAESRGLLIESVGQGYRSKGFQLYSRLAGTGLGETGDAYRLYLFSLFDELAIDLPALFDRYAPEGRLFPREAALLEVLALINAHDIAPLWTEDETIGWIYQYFNSGEERRQMRAESQAPRNSRELAVRNQFFTPRYVVEFLTDNTLGRIWYEMTKGNTRLKESCHYLVRRPTEIFLAEGDSGQWSVVSNNSDHRLLTTDYSQEDLLRQPFYIPHRPLKDPRDIKMLDPACGSMHFGLYAFDLFERIYGEAWEMQVSGQWSVAGNQSDHRPLTTDHRPLTTDYSSKEAFLRDVPRLIVEHNIHGIDIDPRADQIAGLSLWLRAQRSWQAQGLRPQERPAIQRSHIVCAEPMPGDQALLEEFLASLRADRLEGLIRRVLDLPAGQQVRATARVADVLCDLVRVVWDEMKLAGEAGSLLKIEETLAHAVRAAEREWSERMPLFRVVEFSLSGEAGRVRYPKGVPGQEGADFWQQAEALVLAALQDYAEQAQNGAGYQRRLFASDAARGFAFVDLCRKRYDVVLMNPPFGAASTNWRAAFEAGYPITKNDLYAAFVERALQLSTDGGRIGAITSRTGFFLTRFQKWRETILLRDAPPTVFADLGHGVLDSAMVETAAYCLQRSNVGNTIFFRLLDADDKAMALNTALKASSSQFVFIVSPSSFSQVPGSPFAYWVSEYVRQLFVKYPAFETSQRRACITNPAGDDQRFIRGFVEVPPNQIGKTIRWVPITRGGRFSPFFTDLFQVVDWRDDDQTYRGFIGTFHRPLKKPASLEYFFRPGITWPLRGIRFSAQAVPEGCIFSVAGKFATSDQEDELPTLLGVMNSTLFDFLIGLFAGKVGGVQYEVGLINKVPLPDLDGAKRRRIGELALLGVASRREIACASEITHVHYLPSLLQTDSGTLSDRASQWNGRVEAANARLTATRLEIDEIVYSTYGISGRDRQFIEQGFGGFGTDEETISETDEEEKEPDDADALAQVAALLSYSVGVLFGRWDFRFAAREKPKPELPGPFALLPGCPPGMLQNAHGLPAAPADVPAGYPLRISWPGILVDDPGHPEDIEVRVRDALRVVWPDNADAIEQEACQILGVGSLREYFASPSRFFGDHLKRYSKSRRQAPIYWPLSTRSGSYTLWLYYHRLSDQVLYTCVNDFVDPKLAVLSGQLAVLRRKSGCPQDEERELEELTDLELELKDLRAELLRIAAFWRPNLNDGVQITAAPLWRLFQHRPWQKTLKETWEKLEAGEYDWAHLAMSIWPERVVPKCVTDRSLAIAHDVEDLFWVEDPDGKWRNLRSPDEELADLADRQRSPARERLRDLLGELGRGRARGLRCAEVAEELSAGRWDDLEAALLLWPERVAEKCWDDPLLAVTLKINLPTKRSKSARERWVKEIAAVGCPDLAAALEEALREGPDRFAAFWSDLARGDRDHLSLAMALWPARVVEKCAADADLAAQQGVRRFLWVCRDGVWRRRKLQKQDMAGEIARRDQVF